jgi:ATP-dependent 26S proteasome regulatory subunit
LALPGLRLQLILYYYYYYHNNIIISLNIYLYVGTTRRPEEQLVILEALTRRLNLAEECDLAEVVSSLPAGLSGADLSGLVSGAALTAIRREILLLESGADGARHPEITTADFLVAAKNFNNSIAVL